MSAVPKQVPAPYGWQWRAGSGLDPVPEEQHALRQIRLHAAFGAVPEEIAELLEREGLLPRSEGQWTAAEIQEILEYNDELLWMVWLSRELGE